LASDNNASSAAFSSSAVALSDHHGLDSFDFFVGDFLGDDILLDFFGGSCYCAKV
jgi:hypothetical protein